jgi:hypothetical protein
MPITTKVDISILHHGGVFSIQLCPVIPTSNQDGRKAKNRKKGDEFLIVHCCFSISQHELKFLLQLHGKE